MRYWRRYLNLWGLILLLAALAYPHPSHAESDKPVVRAVMFWMESCGHCHYVIDDVLPPIQEHYGDQLEILLIELLTIEDADLLYHMADSYGIPINNVGVPLLFIGDRALSGSQQIPLELPALIEQHLAQGGIDYPERPGLEAYLPGSAVTGDPSDLDDDEDTCSLQAPCPEEAEAHGYPPPPTSPPASQAASLSESYPSPQPGEFVQEPPSDQGGASEAALSSSVNPPEELEGSQESQSFPLVQTLTGAVLGMAAFVLFNFIKTHRRKSRDDREV